LHGDTIVIEYNAKRFHIDVLEVRPDKAISVVETDVNVDFAPPKDYKEPDYKAEAAKAAALAQAATAELQKEKKESGAAMEEEAAEPKFMMFGGALTPCCGLPAAQWQPSVGLGW
jgi:ubiquitin fusion degradation protein 1